MAIVTAFQGGQPTLYDIPDNELSKYKQVQRQGASEQDVNQMFPQGNKPASQVETKLPAGTMSAGGGADVQAYGGLCYCVVRLGGRIFGYYCDCDTDERLGPVELLQ